jgi:hypothetical protein
MTLRVMAFFFQISPGRLLRHDHPYGFGTVLLAYMPGKGVFQKRNPDEFERIK